MKVLEGTAILFERINVRNIHTSNCLKVLLFPADVMLLSVNLYAKKELLHLGTFKGNVFAFNIYRCHPFDNFTNSSAVKGVLYGQGKEDVWLLTRVI